MHENPCLTPTGAAATAAERRSEMRYASSGNIVLYDASQSPAVLLGSGVLIDLSLSGFCVQMGQRLATGTVVEVTGCGERRQAICRHASTAYTGFIMGFEFLDTAPRGQRRQSALPATW